MFPRQTALFLLLLALFTTVTAYAQDLTAVASPEPAIPAPQIPALPSPELPDTGISQVEPVPVVRPRDIVLVLDNSTSMQTSDPQRQLAGAVFEFVAALDSGTSIAVVLYGQDVNLALPLTPATIENRERIAVALALMDYTGYFSDSPAALERAATELSGSGRTNADKTIIFLTDGEVQTANPAADNERSAWLQQGLAADIAAAGIHVYGLGFATAANSELVKTVALKTGGESFHAGQANELPAVFASIIDYMRQEPGPVTAAPVIPLPEPVTPPPPTPVAVTSQQTVTPAPQIGQEERTRSMIIMGAAVILIITLVALIALLVRRGRLYRQSSEVTVSEAYLYDLTGRSASPNYKLGKKPVMLGRVAGKDTEHLDYIVIPESTIGRRHATIEYKDYAYWIMDQGSINGTFVNDMRVTSETRLKHGDRIRLHKIELDFVMPDLEEAGMTRVANTDAAAAVAGSGPVIELDAESVKSSLGSKGVDLDLGFSDDVSGKGDSDETLMPGFGSNPVGNNRESDEVTLMPDYNHGVEADPEKAVTERGRGQEEDETLMPDSYNGVEDDATLRPSSSGGDDIFDVTGADDKDR